MKTADYELVLMLDSAAPEQAREALAGEARAKIESAGELRHAESWGVRKLAYEIEQRNEADYRFFRFTTPAPSLDDLRHSLRIADGVLRFRIFEVDPQSPLMTPPEITLGPSSRDRDGRGRRPRRDDEDFEAEAEGEREEPAAEPEAPAAEAEAPAAEAPEAEAPAAEAPEPEAEAEAPAAEPEAAAEPPAEADAAPERPAE